MQPEPVFKGNNELEEPISLQYSVLDFGLTHAKPFL